MKKTLSRDRDAVGYIRVSTSGQVHEGTSLDGQEAAIMGWANERGFRLLRIERDEGVSGTKSVEFRPGLQSALELACETKAALVVYSLSRMARSVKDAVEIGHRLGVVGADLVSITENWDTTTANGKLLFGIMAVLAQFERDIISERTKAALRYKKDNGELIGQVPYGFRKVVGTLPVRIEQDAKEQSLISLVLDLREKGTSQVAVAEHLNTLGLRTRRGTPWSNVRICQLLQRLDQESHS